jgi:rhodanese-related sulfurtransferase
MKYASLFLSFILIVVVVTIYMNPLQYFEGDSPLQISVAEAKARRFGLIVDVRTPEQRNRLGYYPNSIPISIERLQSEVPLDISNKLTWILVYSNGDQKARFAAEKLYEMGYPNVRYIQETYLTLMPGSQ